MNEASASGVEQEVEIVRTVRFGRLMIVGAFAGAVLAALVALSFPVANASMYTMGQIVGFVFVFGGVIGLALGAALALLLNLFARKKQGRGIAIHHDVDLQADVSN